MQDMEKDSSSARFRSATEFPKTVESLSHAEAEQLYDEIRACLIFTNRSRAQLLRRNEEHKQSAFRLQADVGRLQTLIKQLNLEKQNLAQEKQLVVAELEREVVSMTTHLDQLSAAFDTIPDIETSQQTQWSFLALPSRFFNFIRVVRTIVLAWRQEGDQDPSGTQVLGGSPPQLPSRTENATENIDDHLEHPQMYEDSASLGRSLLDK